MLELLCCVESTNFGERYRRLLMRATHCPSHAHDELKRDWDRIVKAANGSEARAAYSNFVRKWSRLVPAVARSLEEAGLVLLTFYEFPKPMWKTRRTTNPLENLNRGHQQNGPGSPRRPTPSRKEIAQSLGLPQPINRRVSRALHRSSRRIAESDGSDRLGLFREN